MQSIAIITVDDGIGIEQPMGNERRARWKPNGKGVPYITTPEWNNGEVEEIEEDMGIHYVCCEE